MLLHDWWVFFVLQMSLLQCSLLFGLLALHSSSAQHHNFYQLIQNYSGMFRVFSYYTYDYIQMKIRVCFNIWQMYVFIAIRLLSARPHLRLSSFDKHKCGRTLTAYVNLTLQDIRFEEVYKHWSKPKTRPIMLIYTRATPCTIRVSTPTQIARTLLQLVLQNHSFNINKRNWCWVVNVKIRFKVPRTKKMV